MKSRREFLKAALGATGMMLLAACSQPQGSSPTAAPKPTAAPAAKTEAKPTEAAKPAGQPAAAPTAAPAAKPAESKPAAAERYTIGLGALPKNLDPNSDVALTSMAVYRLLYDNLIRLDENGKAQPALATSWSLVSPTVREFKLRQGVKFHNGEALDAEAVRFSLADRVINPEAKSGWAPRLNMVEKVEVVDPATVRLHTKGPSATLLNNLALGYVLPPKYFQEKGPDGFANNPVGTGPMRFKSWKPGDQAQLEANPDYWGGRSQVGAVEFRGLPEDASRMASLQAGELSIGYGVPPELVPVLEQRGLSVVQQPIGQMMAIALRTTVPGPLQDKRVRHAMNYAVDKKAIVDTLYGGKTRVADGQAVGPSATGYNPNVKAYPYDPNRAKQLLQEAGYRGESITLEGAVGRYPKDKEATEAIAQLLEAAGFKIDLQILESTVWNDKFVNGTIGPAFLLGWLIAPSMDINQAILNLQSTSPRKIGSDKKFDEYFQAQATELDEQKRNQTLMQMAEHIREEALMIFLWEAPGLYGMQKDVKGVQFRADTSLILPGIDYKA